jgi:RNA-directed DNA polymerase
MMQPRASIFGGSWINDGNAGSRYANVDNWPENSNDNLGARGRSDDLILIAARYRLRSCRRITARVSLAAFAPQISQGWWSACRSCFGEYTSRSGRAGRSSRALRMRLSRPAAGFDPVPR